MAQKVQILLTCDLDEEEVAAVQTVSFGYDGYTYAFELCESHLESFNDQMQEYISAARQADAPQRRRGGGSGGGAGRARRGGDVSSGEVRSWARDNGYEISERGRIPAEIRAAYDEATA